MVKNNKFVAEKNNCGLKNKDINKERMMRMEKKNKNALFEITPEIEHFAELCEKNTTIEKDLYSKYEVKRGLRDVNGKGVLAGLTNISDVCATKIVDGKEVPCAGNLYYRGYNIKDLVRGFLEDGHFGFEEIAYLLSVWRASEYKRVGDVP